MTSYVSHLECAYTGQTYDAQKLQTVSNEGKPLLVKYNLDVIRKNIQKIRELVLLMWNQEYAVHLRNDHDIAMVFFNIII